MPSKQFDILDRWFAANWKLAVGLLFLTAFVLRLLFSFHFQIYYYGDLNFSFRDSLSYTAPAINLLEQGVYQGDLFVQDSKFFRVPVYPSFLGFFYFLFGAAQYEYVVAVAQCLIDAISVILVFLITRNIVAQHLTAFVAAGIYASYPFVILWTPAIYTEILALSLMWTLVLLVQQAPSTRILLAQGVVCSLLVLTKQYLGLLFLLPLIQLLWSRKSLPELCKCYVILGLGFCLLLLPWFARNTYENGQLTLLRGETTGLRSVQNDYESFERFANLYNEDITPLLFEVFYDGTLTLPNKHEEFTKAHELEIRQAVELAHECGDSFVEWRDPTPLTGEPYRGCKDLVADKFDQLAAKFWQEVPLWSALQTRRDSLYKVFAKSDMASADRSLSKPDFFKRLLFKFRQVLLILGFVGILMAIARNPRSTATGIFLAASGFYCLSTLVKTMHFQCKALAATHMW